ncbi:hypothetical protein ABZ540_23615 [Nocardia xishanensis]|uniref:hypothetical protein n=1 Tax=Nocardia xishanensis TaxID=238964 RepID=UPI0033D9B9FA
MWAEPGGGVIGGGGPSGIATYWRTEDFSSGVERCVIRTGSRTAPVPPGGDDSDFEFVEAGLQGAEVFMNTDYLLWWRKSMYDGFPPNLPSGE